MKTIILATSPYLQGGKSRAKSCQIQQSKYVLGIPGAAPTADLICACPSVTNKKESVRTDLTSVVIWFLLQGFNTCPVGLQKQMFYTHHSDIFPAFGNQNSQTEALALKDKACLQKERIQDNQWFLTALFPRCPFIFSWIFSPGEFKDYLLIKNFVYSIRSVRGRHSRQVQNRLSDQLYRTGGTVQGQEALFRCDILQSDVFLSEKFHEQEFWIRTKMCGLSAWR